MMSGLGPSDELAKPAGAGDGSFETGKADEC